MRLLAKLLLAAILVLLAAATYLRQVHDVVDAPTYLREIGGMWFVQALDARAAIYCAIALLGVAWFVFSEDLPTKIRNALNPHYASRARAVDAAFSKLRTTEPVINYSDAIIMIRNIHEQGRMPKDANDKVWQALERSGLGIRDAGTDKRSLNPEWEPLIIQKLKKDRYL